MAAGRDWVGSPKEKSKRHDAKSAKAANEIGLPPLANVALLAPWR